jgi:hypothetical protein
MRRRLPTRSHVVEADGMHEGAVEWPTFFHAWALTTCQWSLHAEAGTCELMGSLPQSISPPKRTNKTEQITMQQSRKQRSKL